MSYRPTVIPSTMVSRCLGLGGLGLLGAAALIVLGRRMAGAFERPLSPLGLLTAGLLLAVAAAAIHLGWSRLPAAKSSSRPMSGVMVLTSLCVALFGVGLCVSGTSVVAIVLFWILLAGEEAGAWWRHVKRGRESLFTPKTHSPAPPKRNSSDPLFSAVPADEITQQLTRSQATDGAEQLAGWLRTTFAAGQRTGSIHVAFCPPFRAAPEVAVTQIDGPEVRIKAAQRQPYGVRLDLKLAAAAEEPVVLLLQFSARQEKIGD